MATNRISGNCLFSSLCYVRFALILLQVFPLRVWAGEAPRLSFTSPSMGNVFIAEQGDLDLLIDNPKLGVSGIIMLVDETGTVVNKLSVPAGASKVLVNLPRKGYYNISAAVRYQDGSQAEAHTTAAVIGTPLAEAERLSSGIGTWHVNGNLDLAFAAGSRWTRAMWRVNNYQLDSHGHIVPQPLVQTLDKRFSWIGTLAFGLPPWLDGRPLLAKADALYPPTDWGQFEGLIRQFAQDVPDFPNVFELYNEPDVHWTWNRSSLPDFIKFHSVLARAIKSVHPNTKVIGPCLWTVDLPGIKGMVEAGLLDHLDGLSLHGYVVGGTPPEGDFIEHIVNLKSYLRSLGKGNFPIYITEFGWSSGNGGSGVGKHVDELTQARYVSRALALLTTQDLAATIHFVLLQKTNNDAEAGFSLLHADQTPKPSYAAFANASKWLADTTNPRWLKIFSSTHLLLLDKGKGTIAVAWDVAEKGDVFFPQMATVVQDMMGRNIETNQPLLLTSSPVYFKINRDSVVNLVVKQAVQARPGQVLTLPYEKLWLPVQLTMHDNSRITIPRDAKNGSYIVFGKHGNNVDVFRVDISPAL